jgi:hypothetical protein
LLSYRLGPASDPFHDIFSSRGWLTDYDPPGEFPFWVNLEPTNVCQLDCLFCSRRLSRRPPGFLDLGMAREIFDEVKGRPGAAVRLTGWGEPLAHPRIGELCAEAKRRGIRLKIYTNGLLLTERLFDQLADMGVDEIQFSLQGLSGPQYEFNRRGARWEDLRARMLMAAARRGERRRPYLSILTSVLASELEGHDPAAFCSRWLRSVDKVAVDLTNLNFVSATEEARPHLGRQSQGLIRGRCVDVFLALEAKHDGALQFCGQDADGRDCHTIGRFGEMSLAEAWRHPRMEAQRELVGRGLGHDGSPVCRNCYHNTTKYDLFKKALAAEDSAAESGGARASVSPAGPEAAAESGPPGAGRKAAVAAGASGGSGERPRGKGAARKAEGTGEGQAAAGRAGRKASSPAAASAFPQGEARTGPPQGEAGQAPKRSSL